LKFYTACEKLLHETIPVVRFKHMSGENATASSWALWLACYMLQQQSVPAHMLKRTVEVSSINTILFYNNYKGIQHSFMLVRKN